MKISDMVLILAITAGITIGALTIYDGITTSCYNCSTAPEIQGQFVFFTRLNESAALSNNLKNTWLNSSQKSLIDTGIAVVVGFPTAVFSIINLVISVPETFLSMTTSALQLTGLEDSHQAWVSTLIFSVIGVYLLFQVVKWFTRVDV